jgi:hypothetical protein
MMAEAASFKNGDTPRMKDRYMDFQITIDDREKSKQEYVKNTLKLQ